jgi:hypothetical protein
LGKQDQVKPEDFKQTVEEKTNKPYWFSAHIYNSLQKRRPFFWMAFLFLVS